MRRWTAAAAVAIWMAIRWQAQKHGDFDFQAWAIFAAWETMWGALIVVLWTDLKHWFAKVFFALCIVASLANLGEALGIMHFTCPMPREAGAAIEIGPSACIPRLGALPGLN